MTLKEAAVAVVGVGAFSASLLPVNPATESPWPFTVLPGGIMLVGRPVCRDDCLLKPAAKYARSDLINIQRCRNFFGRGETFFNIPGKIERNRFFISQRFAAPSMIYLPCSERTRSERVSTHSSIFPSSSPTSSILFLFPKQKAKRSNLISNRRKKSGWKRIGRDGRREREKERRRRQGHEVITLSTVFRAPSLSVSVSFYLSVSLSVPSRFLPLRDFACGAGASII